MKNEINSHPPIPLFPHERVNLSEGPLSKDYLKEPDDIFFREKKRQSITAAPSYRLFDILPKLTVDKLRYIYRTHLLKPAAGKLKKQELIDALLPVLTDKQELELFIKMLPDMEWSFFKDALDSKELNDEPAMYELAGPALRQGYAYLFCHQEKFVYSVPDEVKAAFKKIDRPQLHEYMVVRLWLNQIACAAVNLYGALPLKELAEIINKQNNNKGNDVITPDILHQILLGYDFYHDDYRFGEGYIAAIDFTSDISNYDLDMDEVRGLMAARKGKPRYLPDIRTFLAYADPDYYEQTSHIKALNKALRSMGLSEDDTQDLIDTLHFKIASEEDAPEVLEALNECGVILESDHVDKILPLITKLFNTTRLWCNYGHTPDEIVKMMGREQPRAIHFGPGIEKMFVNGEMKIGDLERSSMGHPLINDDFNDSFMSEIARMKNLVEDSGLSELHSNTGSTKKPGRNDPCPCGSGLKYKKCCGKNMGNPG